MVVTYSVFREDFPPALHVSCLTTDLPSHG